MTHGRTPRLLALDFDGVISDSAPESYAVAAATYAELGPASGQRSDFDRSQRIALDRAPTLASIESDPRYHAFVEAMPLGNRAEDFGVVLGALEAQQALRDQRDYDRIRDATDPAWRQAFHARFYQLRSELSVRDPQGWLTLMKPYPAFIDVLRRRSDAAILTIATAKDRGSVEKLLDSYGIADLFGGDDRFEHVFDKETGVHKHEHLVAIHRAFGVPYDEICFIDDKPNHLDVVAKLGVRCGLATWGYNGSREIEWARRAGHDVLRLDDVESMLFGAA